jgi:hypothetical protein
MSEANLSSREHGPLHQRADVFSPGVIGDPAQDRSGPFTLTRPGVRGADHDIAGHGRVRLRPLHRPDRLVVAAKSSVGEAESSKVDLVRHFCTELTSRVPIGLSRLQARLRRSVP